MAPALPVYVDWIIAFLLGSSVVGTVRIFIGPTAADRLNALNLVASQVLVLLVLTAVRSGSAVYLDVAMVYAVFGFIGILALTKFLSGRGEQQ
jgi:multicomponent Na+:H+ antiporter subunit F